MTKFFTRSAALGVLAAVFLTGCSANNASESTPTPKTRATYSDGTTGTVKEVKSGNTVSVQIDDQVKDVRLLNLVAPTSTNVEMSGDCLIDESTQFLAEKLPAGTEITLNFDETQTGTSGYVDAAVYVGDDFINKDIAASGLVATTYASPSDEFYPEISAGQQQAARDGIGLYDPNTECTIPHALQAQIDAVNAANDSGNAEESKTVYQEASQLYNRLQKDGESAVTWTGSIVTLDAVRAELEELYAALGKNYYDKDGKTAADAKAEATETGRPDIRISPPAETESAEEAPAENG